ncbi:tetratricopeptide repeat protein [Streptomyces sp. NPDC007818]|uniref:tetratricopeptide repeat protein n=1 Tax=Streptomyces sp. NPDC007818 TaxID=3364780 RepID=UPI0036A9C502
MGEHERPTAEGGFDGGDGEAGRNGGEKARRKPADDTAPVPPQGGGNSISGGELGNVIMAGTVHGGVTINSRGGDTPSDLENPVIASVQLRPGGTLADLVVDADPPRVMVPSGTIHVITLEARTNRAVVLDAARPVVLARRPPRPACLLTRIGAKIEPRRFTTDFDVRVPQMRAQGADFPFSISAADVEQFWFEPIARTHEIAWQLELDWTCAGRRGTTVVDNNGEPFEVYPVAALFDGRADSVLNSGCGLFHEPGCPSLLLEESGAPTSLWTSARSSSLPSYPAPGGPRAAAGPATASPHRSDDDDNPEGLRRHILALHAALAVSDPELPASWPDYRKIASLVRTLFHRPDHRGHESPEFRALLVQVLRYLYVSGQHEPGVTLGRVATAAWSETLGEDHPDTLAVANRLAGCLIGLGEHAEAGDLFADLLPRCERVLGWEAPLTLTVGSNLCACLFALGAHQEARQQCEDVLRRSRLALGPDDPRTLRAASNLAIFLRRLDDHQAARAVLEDTLQRYRRVLGEDHPDTRHAQRDLVALLRVLGEPDRAQAVAGDLPAGP